MGILIAYYDPLYHLNNQVFFHCSNGKVKGPDLALAIVRVKTEFTACGVVNPGHPRGISPLRGGGAGESWVLEGAFTRQSTNPPPPPSIQDFLRTLWWPPPPSPPPPPSTWSTGTSYNQVTRWRRLKRHGWCSVARLHRQVPLWC